MLGIHVSEGTAKGWFGQGKTSAILSIIVLAVLILGIGFGIWAATNVWGETNISQPIAPAAPAAPTPVTPPAVTNSPAPSGIIQIAAEELVRQLMTNPNKYQEGTVFQVSGTLVYYKGAFFLGPMIESLPLKPEQSQFPNIKVKFGVEISFNATQIRDQELRNSLKKLNEGSQVVIQGTYTSWNPNVDGVYLKKVSLISSAPVK